MIRDVGVLHKREPGSEYNCCLWMIRSTYTNGEVLFKNETTLIKHNFSGIRLYIYLQMN